VFSWEKAEAGYKAAFLFMIPVFVAMACALKTERNGILIFVMLVWLIFGNIVFFKAYHNKK